MRCAVAAAALILVIASPAAAQRPPTVSSGDKEIRIGKTLDLGSHMLLCGEWSEDVLLRPPTPHLHHIHFLYYLHQKRGKLPYPIVS